MATLRQVAEAANVSPATVSRVLGRVKSRLPVSEDTSRRVREAAERLGYRVNYHMQAVATGRANAIGFTSETLLDARIGSGEGNLYFDALRRGLEYTTQEAGSALVSIRPGKGRSALQRGTEFLLERRLDALVVPGSKVVEASSHLFEARPALPIVMVNPLSRLHRPQIRFDVEAAMRLIVGHLKELEHKEVLWFGPDTDASSGASLRRQLFVEAAWEAGIRGTVCTVDTEAVEKLSDMAPRLEKGRATMARHLASHPRRWTAVVAYSDYWAVSACAALREAGLDVPRDVSIVGFDNLIAEFCLPALTTIDHRFYEMGRRAGELASRIVELSEAERVEMLDYQEVVQPTLVVRESTAKAPKRR